MRRFMYIVIVRVRHKNEMNNSNFRKIQVIGSLRVSLS